MKIFHDFQRLRNKVLVFLFTILPMPLFASIVPSGMYTLADNIVGVFTGPIVRTILVIALCGTAIAYGVNKDNDRMKKGIIAVGVSIALLIASTAIVDAVWTAASG